MNNIGIFSILVFLAIILSGCGGGGSSSKSNPFEPETEVIDVIDPDTVVEPPMPPPEPPVVKPDFVHVDRCANKEWHGNSLNPVRCWIVPNDGYFIYETIYNQTGDGIVDCSIHSVTAIKEDYITEEFILFEDVLQKVFNRPGPALYYSNGNLYTFNQRIGRKDAGVLGFSRNAIVHIQCFETSRPHIIQEISIDIDKKERESLNM